jgi:nucleotide-binding universal stress UspA family protein
MRSIIVPIDGSPQSIQALRFAIGMARAFGDELVLLSVHGSSQILGENMLREAVTIAEQESVPYRTKVRVGGNPTIEISFEANDPGVRCIVMGLRGSGSDGASGKTLGSVSQGLLQLATRPITFVPYGG